MGWGYTQAATGGSQLSLLATELVNEDALFIIVARMVKKQRSHESLQGLPARDSW